MAIPESIIDEIRERISVSEVVSPYVRLKKVGTSHKGLCPFHHEKTPSFVVSDQKRIYHCFGCGETGSVFTFLMKVENLSFPEAVKALGERVGVAIPEGSEETEARIEHLKALKRALDLNRAVAGFFHDLLRTDEGKEAREYLKKRQLDEVLVDRYLIGYGGSRWDTLVQFLRSRELSIDLAQQLGIIGQKDKEHEFFNRFKGRLIFPILDAKGEVIGFGGRALDGREPKYLNSSASATFDKSESLYGINIAKKAVRREGALFITEGYVDVITLHKYGYENTVATLGTALTDRHVRRVKGLTSRIYLIYDADKAGQEATKRALKLFLRNGVEARVVRLAADEDADSFLLRYGKDRFEESVKSAGSLLDFFIENELNSQSSATQKSKLVNEVLEVLGEVPDAIERDLIVQEISKRFQLSVDLLRGRLGEESRRDGAASRLIANQRVVESVSHDLSGDGEAAIGSEEEFLLGMLLHHPRLFLETVDLGDTEKLLGERARAIVRDLADRFVQGRPTFPDGGSANFSLLIEETADSKLKSLFARIGIEDVRFGEGVEDSAVVKMIQDGIRALKLRLQKRHQQLLSRHLREAQESKNENRIYDVLKKKNELLKSLDTQEK